MRSVLDVYEADQVSAFINFQTQALSIYQLIHSLCEAVALLINAEHSIGPKNLGGQLEAVVRTNHPFAASLASRSREIQLLQWLATVRNRSVQHAADNGYSDNKAVIARAGFVMIKSPKPPDAVVARHARQSLVGLTRQFGAADQPGVGDREAIAFLDLKTHEIYRDHAGRADPSREIIRRAAVHYIVVSSAMLDNVAWALRRVLELLPEHADVQR